MTVKEWMAEAAGKDKEGSVVREFQIPLPSGATATIKVPFPMSGDDFDQLQDTLTCWMLALTNKTAQ